MKDKKERLEKLENEEFYLNFFEGTYMPNNPKYIKILMFNDIIYIENEAEEKEKNIDKNFFAQVKEMIENNIENIEKMSEAKGNPIKSSFQQKFDLMINHKMYHVNKNVCNEEERKLFDDFKLKLLEILNLNN